MVVIYSISRLTTSTVKALVTHRTGLVRFKAVDSITRQFLSKSVGWNSQVQDEMQELKDKIAEHERELKTVVDLAERTAIRNQIFSCRNDITALRQQGEKFVHETSPPSPRKERWIALNQILDDNKNSNERRNGEFSTSFSSVKHHEVKRVFGPLIRDYYQSIKALPDAKFEFLSQLLAMTSTILGGVRYGNEAHRRHLIFPILLMVCNQFDGQARIKVEEELTGKNLSANGHFEFMLQRGNKRVCIVEAKKEDMEQGRAQCLIGCEVASDLDNLRVVYGIVTTFELWTFLRSCDDRIEQDHTLLLMEEGVVNPDSLKKIAGKIYAMLSDDD